MARPKNKRDIILSAAKDAFLEKGFSNVSMQDIASRADIGKGTIYEYFKSKDELFVNTIDFISKTFLEMLKMTVENCIGFDSKLKAIVEAIQKVTVEGFTMIEYYVSSEIKVVNPGAMCELHIITNNVKTKIEQIIVDVIAEGISENVVIDNQDRFFTASIISGTIMMSCLQWNKEKASSEKIEVEKRKLYEFIMYGINGNKNNCIKDIAEVEK